MTHPNCGNLAVDNEVYDSDDMPEGHTADHLLMETQTELGLHANYDAFVDLEDNQKSSTAEENGDEEEEEEEEHEVEEEETEDEAVEEEEPKSMRRYLRTSKRCPIFHLRTTPSRVVRHAVRCYPGVTMMLQHRSHLFMILIYGPCTRFIHWDRFGAIVIKGFDYTKKRTLIFNFYKCFFQSSSSQRGKDPTIFPLTDDDDDTIARGPVRYGHVPG